MQDFSIVIPTYNRPRELARLLCFLDRVQVPWRVLVLDSSHPPERQLNRATVARLRARVGYHEYPIETHPFDKFRDGTERVETPFCAFCADDDVILPSGSSSCIDVLRSDADAAVAQGYSFQFLEYPDGRFDLTNVLYFTPTILDKTPLERVAKQFEQYQATTYGHYRTAVLRDVFRAIEPVKSLLARELLSSALSTVAGKVVRVQRFSNGRSMGASVRYDHWHPLEWFAKDADGFMAEYRRYRDILIAAIVGRPDNLHDEASIKRIVDLIHLQYMVRHAPPDALRYMMESEVAGVAFNDYWADHRIQIPLIEASGIRVRQPTLITQITGWLSAPWGTGHRARPISNDLVSPSARYGVTENFAKFCASRFGPSARSVIGTLIDELDIYRLPAALAEAAEPP